LGTTVVLPLTEAAYHEFRKGKVAYPELIRGGICDEHTLSKHVLLHSYSEVKPSVCRLRKKISAAQVRTGFYQLALHSARQLRRNAEPTLLCITPLDEYKERARAFGFSELMAREPATKASIWEMLPEKTGAYAVMMGMLCALQWLHREDVSG
jgi:hypothetical protein